MKKGILTLVPATLLSAGLALGSSIFSSANAASLSFSPTLSTGDPIGIGITLDDGITAGKVRATVEVTSGLGDLSGVYFDLLNNSLLGDLTFEEVSFEGASGSPSDFISKIEQDGNVGGLGNGVNMNGGSGQSVFEVGLRVGASGGRNSGGTPDDYQKIVFDIGHTTNSLYLSDFSAENWGVRVKSVGDNRNGSSKLVGTVPNQPTPSKEVPEPASLLGLGLIGGAMAVSRRRSKQTA